jgi:hypothetical protein
MDLSRTFCSHLYRQRTKKGEDVAVHSAMVYGGRKVKINSFLTSALGGVSGQLQAQAALSQTEVPHSTHWLGGYMGTKVCLEAVEDIEIRDLRFNSCVSGDQSIFGRYALTMGE